VTAASYPTLYNSYTARGYELDHTSVYDYIEQVVPGGHRAQLGQLLDVAYNIEYGAETAVQSALNLLYLLAYSGQGQLRIFGPSNEKYHVRGGNDQIVSRLAASLAGQITTGAALQAIVRNIDGTYTLTFAGAKRVTSAFLRQIDPLLPGLAAHWNGRASIDYWIAYPWTLGSYSYWKVGQYTSFSGAEKEVSGNCHFAGEHTSQDFQGYLNGAVETGQRAANEILTALK
jgi:monoamine oxidase